MSWITNPNDPVPDQPGLPSPAALGLGFLPVAGQIYDTYQRSKDQKTEIAARKAEAELAYQRQVEMWHLQNQYNSPLEQMKRFGAAGLNPHLIYSQGNPGNSSGTPSYQPPNLQYRGVSPPYGSAIQTILPTLMAVGTWMQNMRMSEVEIESKKTNVEKAEQMIAYLSEKYPREISKLDNLLSLYPYQKSLQGSLAEKAFWQGQSAYGDFSHRYSEGGMASLERAKASADIRLKTLTGDWYEPAAIMRLVLGGVSGLSGLGRLAKPSMGRINPKAKRVKTFYQDGKRRSQVVDFD